MIKSARNKPAKPKKNQWLKPNWWQSERSNF